MAPESATILFVDDDAVNRQTLAWLLNDAGYRVLEAGTGQEALALAGEKPDLVLLDINLPDLDGYEVCRRLRGMSATKHAAVIQMSAVYVESGDRSQGLEQGADAYLVKPIEPRELLAHVRAALRVRAAEEASRRVALDWRSTFDAIGDAVCLLDASGRIRRCNRALAALVNRSFADLLSQPFDEALRDGLRLKRSPELARLVHDPDRELPQVSLGERFFRVTADPILDEDGQLVGSVYILQDVTPRLQLEEHLRQSQRLEAIGRLAGGVAHDFNNLLTAILGNASLLANALPTGEQDHELVKTIERSAWRAAELTRQLLGFSRQTLLWPQQVEVGPLLEKLAESMHRELPPSIQFGIDLGPDLWPIQADTNHLGQVLTQLCHNARDAMPTGGSLTLSARNVEFGEPPQHADARAGEFVRVSVSDTGSGIPAELVGKIFDPFFTTKPTGKGRGLGLAMVYGIIRQHHGWIQCESVVGQGTRFDLYLPRATSNEPPNAPSLSLNPKPE